MNGQRETGQSVAGSVAETFRHFWANRPVRPRHGDKLGGVSAAIGLRYGIDPILFRVGFVVGAFYGGAGVVLYLLGWLLLPKEDEPVPGPYGARPSNHRTSGPMIVLLVVLLIPTVWAMDYVGLSGLMIGLCALYLLHRNYHDHIPETGSVRQKVLAEREDGTPSPSTVDVLGEQQPLAPDQRTETTSGAELEAPRPKRPWGTLGILVLAMAVGGIVAISGAPWMIIVVSTLGVLGLGMLTGSFL